MAKRTKKSTKAGLRMSPDMKRKYAELLTMALETMEASGYTKPWVSAYRGTPCNIYRKNKPYNGVNAFMLTMLMELRGWETPWFITKTQMANEDGNYKYDGLTANASLKLDDNGMAVIDDKGMPVMNVEKRFPVIFFRPIHKDEDGNKIEDEDWKKMTDEEKKDCHTYWYQKPYLVYNVQQTNLPTKYPDDWKEMTKLPEHDYKVGVHDEVLEKIIGGEWICPIRFGFNESLYSITNNEIRMPRREAFLGDEEFYGAVLHEISHCIARQLEIDSPKAAIGTEEYAMDEFDAELSSAVIGSMLGIRKLLNKNSIAYVRNWKSALKTNKDIVAVRIDNVQKIVNYFMKKYDEVAQAHKAATPLLIAA